MNMAAFEKVGLTPKEGKLTPEQIAKGVCMIWPEENGPVGVEYQEHGDEPTFKQYDNE